MQKLLFAMFLGLLLTAAMGCGSTTVSGVEASPDSTNGFIFDDGSEGFSATTSFEMACGDLDDANARNCSKVCEQATVYFLDSGITEADRILFILTKWYEAAKEAGNLQDAALWHWVAGQCFGRRI